MTDRIIEVRWADENEACILIEDFAVNYQQPFRIGTLKWSDSSCCWTFVRHAPDGPMVESPVLISVDPEGEDTWRRQRQEIAVQPNEALRMALDAELDGRLHTFRDDTRDVAVLGAKVQAREWWPTYQAMLEAPDRTPPF